MDRSAGNGAGSRGCHLDIWRGWAGGQGGQGWGAHPP